MSTLSFLLLALKRLKSRLLLSSLLLLTIALTVAITVSIPAFSGGVSLHIMQQEIDRRSDVKGLPLFSVGLNAVPTGEFPINVQEALRVRDNLAALMQRVLSLPTISQAVEWESPVYRLVPRSDDTTYESEYLAGVRVVAIESVADDIEIIGGRALTEPGGAPDALQIWFEEDFLGELAMSVGERYVLGGLYSSAAEGIPVEIAGAYRATGSSFSTRSLRGRYAQDLLTTPEQFQQFISTRIPEGASMVSWSFVFDERRVNLSWGERYIAALQSIERQAQRTLPNGQLGIAPLEELVRGQQRKSALTLVLYGFSLPILVFLLYFTASLSSMQARYQEQEVATLVSRGSRPWQVLGLAGAETVVLLVFAVPLGTVLGLMLALGLGYAGGFLSFVSRPPLQVSLTSVDWPPVIVMALVNLLVRVATAWRSRRLTIVTHSQLATRHRVRRTVTRYVYLALLVGATAYAYNQLQLRGRLSLASLDVLDPRNDPLLLLAPTLFLFSMPLVAVELFSLVAAATGFLARFLPRAEGYLALLNLARSGATHRLPTYVLILSLSMGVFYASMARSADLWMVEAQEYAYGADLTFRVGFSPESDPDDPGLPPSQVPSVPEGEYVAIPDVEGATRVGDFRATIRGEPSLSYVRLLAVNRLSLPSVAYFRPSYANDSLGELMNRLAQTPDGVLVPASLLGKLGLRVGDTLGLNVAMYEEAMIPVEFTIAGVFDYFPTMYPDNALVLVADLGRLEFQTVGELPHSVWLRLASGADTEAVMRQVKQLLLAIPTDVRDLRETLAVESNRLERTGIFGMLSVCFLAGAVLAVANLLVANTLMLHERSVRHAVLRALGVSLASTIRTVIVEGLVSLVYGMILGVAFGVFTARLYVPFFAVSGSSGRPIPPFLAVIDWSKTEWIAAAMAAAMVAAEALVLVHMLRTRLFEALRMGDRP